MQLKLPFYSSPYTFHICSHERLTADIYTNVISEVFIILTESLFHGMQFFFKIQWENMDQIYISLPKTKNKRSRIYGDQKKKANNEHENINVFCFTGRKEKHEINTICIPAMTSSIKRSIIFLQE